MIVVLSLSLGACVTTTENSIYTNTDVDKKAAARSHVEAALDYLQKGDATNAMRHLRKASEIDPDAADVNATLAYTFELLLDDKMAEQHYRIALRQDPLLTSTHNNYGAFLYKQGRYKEAQRELQKTVEDTLYERRFSAFTNLALCDLKLGNVDLAETNLKQSLALNRRYAPAMLELAAINLEKGKSRTAQDYYDGFRQLSRQNARSLLLGVQIAAATGDQNAFASYQLALKNLYPESEEYEAYQREFESNE